MSVSIVNGFVCFSGCDAAKARKGEDPRERANSSAPADAANARGEAGPAVEFGGALAESIVADAVDPAQRARASESPAARRLAESVDLIV